MKINIFSILLAAGTLLATSCSGFLDEEPTNAANAETAIQAPSDARVVINGIMSEMASSSYYGRNFILYGEAKGGDLTICQAGRGGDALYTFNHTPTTNSYSSMWTQMYNIIMQANNLLENIDRLQNKGEEGYDYYKGEALTIRAMVYFDLVRLYGLPYNYNRSSYGVPNITTTLEAKAQPGRATVEENYKQIMSDLEEAEPLLATDKSQHNGYIGYYANLAEQARVRLYMEDYDEALKDAQEIINSGAFELYSNANWTKSWTTQFGSESIFELYIDVNNDLGESSLGYYLMRYHQVSNAQGNFLASDYYLKRLGEDKTDVRWGIMGEDEVSTTEAPRYGANYKYLGSTTLAGDGKDSYTAVDIKVIRLSEIYLIAAEAALHATQPDKALAAEYLNTIRKRAPKLAPATAETISDDMILDERSKELFCEGQRFFDMIRKNRTIEFNDDMQGVPVSSRSKTIDRTFGKIVLPISQDEINANPTLASEQNKAYK
jgi:hypothetical protein